MLHPPAEDELQQLDWFEECELRRQRHFEALLPCRKWGISKHLPADQKSPYLRCDFCMPKTQATHVMFFPERLFCDKHIRKSKRDKRINWRARALRLRLLEQQRDFNQSDTV
jgi:hypothetical protein